MEILKLKPAYKDYLWGGHRLVEQYNKESDLDKVAETWELSNHKDGSSTIANGKHKGESFRDYIDHHDKSIWGKHCAKYDNFPILIKFIDALQDLSIQVHPDDDYALENEGEYGKNEFWYVLEADENSILYYGVKKEMTKDEYRQHIEDNTICDYLKKVKVKKGDCFFIKAGTIHAIGAGLIICEIQQCSNTTYRVYDFNRVGDDGKPRELHIEKAIAVSNLVPSGKNGEPDGPLEKHDGYLQQLLTDNDYFTCIRIDVDSHYQGTIDRDSFQSFIVIEGEGKINDIAIKKGDSLFIPAQEDSYTIEGHVSLIKTLL